MQASTCHIACIYSAFLYMAIANYIICLLLPEMWVTVLATCMSLKGPYPAELLAETRMKHAESPAGITVMLVATGTIKEMCWTKSSVELYWTL